MATLTPRDTDFIDSASIRLTTVATVNATPAEVWAVLTDNERWPEWFPAAKECRTTSAEAQGVGSTRWIHFDLFKVNERFVAWEPPRRWAFTILDANLPGLVSVVEQALIEPAGDGKTVLTYVLAADVARCDGASLDSSRRASPALKTRWHGSAKREPHDLGIFSPTRFDEKI